MGLRSLYFALAGIMGMFHFLKYGLALILTFVGVKMLIKPVSEILLDRGYVATTYEIPIELALGVIGGTLATSVLASLIHRKLSPPPSGEEKELPDVPAQVELDAPNRDETQ
jgi:tellurite resistance protein TerC